MAMHVETLIVGAGQSGLAVSALLSAAGREHAVIDRGDVGERWRSERWDSLRLLTPNWLSRLPGWSYRGPAPEGHMTAHEVAAYLDEYAASFHAPIVPQTAVLRVTRECGRFRVVASRGDWIARNVVAATGAHVLPRVPAGIGTTGIPVVPSTSYGRPSDLPAGDVLVVGASSSGVQIADELAGAGRRVVLAVGRHTRVPRNYRGMDLFWWLERLGKLARTVDELPARAAARPETSLQLVGSAGPPRAVDLLALQARGVQLTGRLLEFSDSRVRFDDGLRDAAAAADAAMHRLLDQIDAHVAAAGLEREVLPARRPPAVAPSIVPLRTAPHPQDFACVVLASGLLPDWSWLGDPVPGAHGTIAQHRGATEVPGLYVVGQHFQHRRDSTYIDGARHNARDVVGHLLAEAPPVVTS